MANVNASINIDAPVQDVWDVVVHGQAEREAKDSLAALKQLIES